MAAQLRLCQFDPRPPAARSELDLFADRAAEEAERAEHYRGAEEYRAYAGALDGSQDLWCQWSERYINWRQLEILDLMSKGNWA